MYVGERKYSATVVAFREILAKLDELDALLRDAPIDAADGNRLARHFGSLREHIMSELRDGELGLWEQNGYPTAPPAGRGR